MADRAAELRALRARLEALADRADRRLAAGPGGAPRLLVRVVDRGAIPAATGHYFACVPARVGGTEGEGNPAAPAAGVAPFAVAVFGSRVPRAGDYLVAHAVPDRWVAVTTGPSCRVCYQAVDLFTGDVLPAATIALCHFLGPNQGGRTTLSPSSVYRAGAYADPDASVCFDFPPGGTPSGLSVLAVEDDGLTVRPNTAVRSVSRTPTGGGPCPARDDVCGCEVEPATVYLTSTRPGIHDTTLTYQAAPAGLTLVDGFNTWGFLHVSTDSWDDGVNAVASTGPYRYVLACLLAGGAYVLWQFWPGTGAKTQIYSWADALGYPAHTCDPFYWTVGPVVGGVPDTRVVLNG